MLHGDTNLVGVGPQVAEVNTLIYM